ncbi:MAG: 1,4-alpha-glucan branching protein domain-containing protein [Acidobacteriota bacterium]
MTSRLILVLHSHLPYVKRQGRWPFGEVWLFEAIAETYIPFIQSWSRLMRDGLTAPLTISLSPTLLEQVSSEYVQEQFIEYLKHQEHAAIADERYYRAQGQLEYASLAADYQRFYQEVRRDFITEFDCDLLGVISRMRQHVPLEILATAATHAYLPLIRDKKSLQRQIETGVETFTRRLGVKPDGFWLPECGYYQGLEDILIDQGVKFFFVDSHAIEGGKPPQIFSDMEVFTEDDIEVFQETGLSTYRPYRIKDKPIAVFGRNAMVSYQVWSKEYGYPGDAVYREFHKQSPRSGLKYWKVSDRNSGSSAKTVYSRGEAQNKLRSQAGHFINVLDDVAGEAVKMGFQDPLIVACYDTELFGHWWWEGVDWLEEVMRRLNQHGNIKMELPSTILQGQDRFAGAQVFESSWGVGGKHMGWDNKETVWMWDTIYQAQQDFEAIEDSSGSDLIDLAVKLARNELMLMESSDWFFMVTNNHTRDYAMKRFFDHYARFARMVEMVKLNRFDEQSVAWLNKIKLDDEIF